MCIRDRLLTKWRTTVVRMEPLLMATYPKKRPTKNMLGALTKLWWAMAKTMALTTTAKRSPKRRRGCSTTPRKTTSSTTAGTAERERK